MASSVLFPYSSQPRPLRIYYYDETDEEIMEFESENQILNFINGQAVLVNENEEIESVDSAEEYEQTMYTPSPILGVNYDEEEEETTVNTTTNNNTTMNITNTSFPIILQHPNHNVVNETVVNDDVVVVHDAQNMEQQNMEQQEENTQPLSEEELQVIRQLQEIANEDHPLAYYLPDSYDNNSQEEVQTQVVFLYQSSLESQITTLFPATQPYSEYDDNEDI